MRLTGSLAGWRSNFILILMCGVVDGRSSWLRSIVHPVLVHCCSRALGGDGLLLLLVLADGRCGVVG
jgi:hypothetical protein